VNKLRSITLSLLLYGAGADVGCAQSPDATQSAFVERYVAAITSQDSAGLKNLLHPTSLACINRENRDYFDFIFAKELSHGTELRGGYTSPVSACLTLAQRQRARWETCFVTL